MSKHDERNLKIGEESLVRAHSIPLVSCALLLADFHDSSVLERMNTAGFEQL